MYTITFRPKIYNFYFTHEPHTFVTLFSGKNFDTPHPYMRYVTLEWPNIPQTVHRGNFF